MKIYLGVINLAILVAIKQGWRNIVVICDSLTPINSMFDIKDMHGEIMVIVTNIKNLITGFEEVRVN